MYMYMLCNTHKIHVRAWYLRQGLRHHSWKFYTKRNASRLDIKYLYICLTNNHDETDQSSLLVIQLMWFIYVILIEAFLLKNFNLGSSLPKICPARHACMPAWYRFLVFIHQSVQFQRKNMHSVHFMRLYRHFVGTYLWTYMLTLFMQWTSLV